MNLKLGSKDVGLVGDRQQRQFEYGDIVYVFETHVDYLGSHLMLEYFHRLFVPEQPSMEISRVFNHTDIVLKQRFSQRALGKQGMWLPDQTIMDWVDLSMPMPDELGVEYLPIDLSAIWAQVREMNIDPKDRHRLLTAIRLLL